MLQNFISSNIQFYNKYTESIILLTIPSNVNKASYPLFYYFLSCCCLENYRLETKYENQLIGKVALVCISTKMLLGTLHAQKISIPQILTRSRCKCMTFSSNLNEYLDFLSTIYNLLLIKKINKHGFGWFCQFSKILNITFFIIS